MNQSISFGKHAKFFFYMLVKGLPSAAASADPQKMALVFFLVSGLDILHIFDEPGHCEKMYQAITSKMINDSQGSAIVIGEEERSQLLKEKCLPSSFYGYALQLVNWIYSLQIEPDVIDGSVEGVYGFRSSNSLLVQSSNNGSIGAEKGIAVAHITMTQTALQVLHIMEPFILSHSEYKDGDLRPRVNRKAILSSIPRLYKGNGCYESFKGSGEMDMRFLYSCSLVAKLLGDISVIEGAEVALHVAKCQNYDGGIGQFPGCESHGGATFCAVASLAILGRLDVLDRTRLIDWLVKRQYSGFQGRVNKPEDTCYTFWIGGCLAILGAENLVDADRVYSFICGAQFGEGGIARDSSCYPDPNHTYLSLAGLSLFHNAPGSLKRVDPIYAMSFQERKR